MKKAKKFLAWLLTAVIVSSSLPLSVFADEANQPSAVAEDTSGFEVSFDVDTGQEEISEDPPADIEATPEPTPEPTAEPTQEPTQEPTPTPESTATPAPTAEPTAVPTATPGVTAMPTAVPTSTPEPSAVPSASPVVTPTPTPTPSPQPVVNPVKLEHDVLDNVDKDCIYLFPVPNGSEITQEYSAEHKAIDIAALSGSPVYAAEDGTVSYVQIWDGSYDTTGMMSYGHMVEIRHADGNTTLYAHLSEINVQQDYVTLLTCTPYGVNTHRLLVRGHRVEMAEEAIAEVEEKAEPAASTWIEKYEQGILIGVAIFLGLLLIALLVYFIKRLKQRKDEKEK